MNKRAKKVSLGEIARRVGVSTVAVSRALLNKPGVSEETRKRIVRAAEELGYVPDARLSSLMAQLRKSPGQELLPIAWLNTTAAEDAWRVPLYHKPYFEGARARARELGYKLDEIWTLQPGMTMKRLSTILYQRGIEGAIVTLPARHVRLDWNHLASVALGASLLAPRLHRVMADLNFNLQLALKALRRLGYRRIGICLWPQVDSASHHTIRALARDIYFSSPRSERTPPLFHAINKPQGNAQEKEMVSWLKRYQPEVIVGHDWHLKEWVERAGYRVPHDVGLVHLAIDDDVPGWAGIHSRRRETGATAVEQVVSLMRNRQYGVPATPLDILIRGSWRTGATIQT
jgi:LacI family transcriptional regulator